jgi:uncharacterized cupredoxin-like copper-binding protein
MKWLSLIAIFCLAFAIAPTGSLASKAAGTSIQVQGGEFFFKLSATSVAKPGTVTFVFKNVGHVGHDFAILGKKTAVINPGKTARLTVTFAKKGRFPYQCSVPGHAAAGMKGLFKVG